MALLGQAALAMWWDMAPDMDAEFQRWHSHEHLRERLAIFCSGLYALSFSATAAEIAA